MEIKTGREILLEVGDANRNPDLSKKDKEDLLEKRWVAVDSLKDYLLDLG